MKSISGCGTSAEKAARRDAPHLAVKTPRVRSGARSWNWSRQQERPRSVTWAFIVERVTRIELAL